MKTIKKMNMVFAGAGGLLAMILLFLFIMDIPVVVFGATLVLIFPVAGFFLSWYFSRRLTALYDGVQIVRSGNLDYKVDIYSEDDIGKISKEFDSVVAELKQVKKELAVYQGELDEKKEEIEELKDKEEHFRRLFEESNDAVFVYDLDGKIIRENKKACDMLGYPQDIFSRVNFFDLQIESETTSSKSASRTGTEACAIRYESRMKKANGEIIDVEISTSGVDMKKGIMQSIVSNITARKNMRKELEKSEEKFRTFMETAGDLMFVSENRGNLEYMNRAMISTLGYLKEESENLSMKDILSQESLEAYLKAEEEVRDKGFVRYETVWETKNRKKTYGELTEVAIFDEDGGYKGSRGVFRDITERKKVEQAQRLANLGKLAADVAHEVNNPITIIMGRAEMLKMQRIEDKELQDKMEIIIQQCDAAISIVKRLLQFSKPSENAFAEVNLNDMVKDVISLVDHQLRADKVDVTTHLTEGLPKVQADGKQIQEVLMNLIRNAGEALPHGGNIDILTYEKEGRVFADIKDNGEGIPDDIIKKIFDPFFTTKKEGTGLGLSVCYGIIKAHKGELLYLSEEGHGTTARVILPALKRKN